ncbi:hypothetical protein IKF04_01385 [Candidatus Saccharibacteria bacterium]|nr:hypothetical protein [Candidatus Saccharibacteria bacterium]
MKKAMFAIATVTVTLTAMFGIFYAFCAYVAASAAWELNRYKIDDAWGDKL